MSSPTRVLIVDDSGVQSSALRQALEREGLEVVDTAADGLEAVRKVAALAPQVVLMDIRMPKKDGLQATRDIMADTPTPIMLMTAAEHLAQDADMALRALEYGALDLIPKPQRLLDPASAADLAARLRLLASVPVISHPRGMSGQRRTSSEQAESSRTTTYFRRASRVVGVVASTGGPQALRSLLAALPSNLKAAVVVVQHIDAGFEESLVRWLDEESKLRVQLAELKQDLYAGMVYVAPQGRFAEVTERRRLQMVSGELTPGTHCPSGDRLLQTLASAYGPRALGVVLTGMGRDGALGLLQVSRQGGITIAQDEATSTIYGMPRAAVDLGAAQRVLPLESIAPAIVEALR